MRKKTSLTPRKDSKQQRSRTTVEAIVEAATQLLSKLDSTQTTTNKIAEKAGVSIGTFYQYFPNKESLIAKLIDRELQNYLLKVEMLFEKNQDEGLEALLQILLEDLCDQFLKRKSMARVFIEMTSDLRKMKLVLAARAQIADKLTKLITSQDDGRYHWSQLKSFIMINSVLGVLYSYIQSETNFTEAEIKIELTRWLQIYLKQT